jgi:hypothetical protein
VSRSLVRPRLAARLVGALTATALVSGVAVSLPASPAFAATCTASVNFGISNNTAAATEYNGPNYCYRVRVHIHAWVNGSFFTDYYGPVSYSTSYVAGYARSADWYGTANPGRNPDLVPSSWPSQQWTVSGARKSFSD